MKPPASRLSSLALLIALVLAPGCKQTSYSSSPTSSGPPSSTDSVPSTTTSNRSLPSGFQSFAGVSGRGEVLYGGMSGTSASGALWGALNALTSYFDAKPQVIGAFVTANDNEVQCLFDAMRNGQAVRGIGYAQFTGTLCLVTIVDDNPDTFGQSSADLVRQAQQLLPPPTSEPPKQLYRTTLPDGSTVDMPAGWTASANNGAVEGQGPEGGFDFGLSVQVHTPEAAAQYYPGRPPLVSAYGDPGREVQELFAQMRIVGSPDDIHIIERAPIQWWTSGVGEALHFQGQVRGEAREWIALVLTSPTGPGTWQYYYSDVGSHQANFNQNLPTLMRIWQSWKTDDRVFQERLMRAVESLQACGRIIHEANALRQDAMERSSMAWDHYVRGTWPVEDQQTRTRSVPPQDVAALVRRLNETEGYDRWRVVPYEQLNR